VTEIAGSSGDVGGEAGPAFTPDAAFSQSLNEQGFWLVTETGRLNVAMDGLQVVNATDYIYDSEDPRQIYALEKADGQAVVHTENGVNFVYYGVIEDGVFVAKQKQIIALPDMGLPGVEAGTLIASDPLAIPEDLRAGLDLQPGTVLIGLTGRGADGSGQALALAASVFKIDDTVLVFQNADGSLTITTSGEDGDRTYTLHVDPEALAPEVIDYGICTPEAFRECPVPPEDLFNGNYLAFLETLSRPFDKEKIKNVPLIYARDGLIMYDISNLPNFADPETAPFRRNVTSGVTTFEGNEYIILPIEFADPKDPENPDANIWIIGVSARYSPGYTVSETDTRNVINIWMNEMNMAPFKTGPYLPFKNLLDPLVNKGFTDDPDLGRKIDDFVSTGDPSGLRGKVLLIEIARSSWYK
jgi:hypothetical protein